MQQALENVQQLRQEANIPRKKVSEVAKNLVEFCESRKDNDCFVTGHIENNPYQEKKSCLLL
ncbi:unnamed protein product [Meloidogyne enterolobii]|uniref:Guanine nucleotide-binding protein subunit gamma n=4 Tax=Meloidogyne TaxID=189290 RepID=A0A6V7XF57_MELEN|nr:unnamed protein product [Meloidogyne enterolobii]CAD2134429.1 unnamed protein product [Meloidogyne enterolobii]CAD2197861.1 unnamed protein product [Meloidogyne enterolobii]